MDNQGLNRASQVSYQASPIEINRALRHQAADLLLEIAALRERVMLSKEDNQNCPKRSLVRKNARSTR